MVGAIPGEEIRPVAAPVQEPFLEVPEVSEADVGKMVISETSQGTLTGVVESFAESKDGLGVWSIRLVLVLLSLSLMCSFLLRLMLVLCLLSDAAVVVPVLVEGVLWGGVVAFPCFRILVCYRCFREIMTFF